MIKRLIAAFVGAALASFTRPTPTERLYGPQLMGPIGHSTQSGGAGPNAATQFVGRTTLGSGTAFVTVSTRMVNSDSFIQSTFIPNATVSSGALGTGAVGPMSLVEGVSFVLGYADGAGRAPGGTVCWEIRNNR